VGGGETMFIHDFGVVGADGRLLDLERCGDRVARALQDIWLGRSPSDSLNRLILETSLTHEQIAVLRGYLTYWRRVSPVFTVDYFNYTLLLHSNIMTGLMRVFEPIFDPDADGSGFESQRHWLLDPLVEVQSLDEDRIPRRLMRLREETVKTNFYRPDLQS